MLFPCPMLRLTWFLPESRLCTELERLASTGAFHLSDRVRLGQTSHLHELEAAYRDLHRSRRYRRGRELLERMPAQTMLNYRCGQLPPEKLGQSDVPGLVLSEDGFFLWSGESDPPEEIVPYLFPEEPVGTPSLTLEVTEAQWRMLLATAEQIGHVGPWAIIDGWIPRRDKGRFKKMLRNEAVTFCAAEHSGLPFLEVPVRYERPEWMEGFAALMSNFGLTGYRELDPTVLLAVGFVVMFGMMFADFGQGLLLAVTGVILLLASGRHGGPAWTRRPSTRIVAKVLVPIGLSAAVFGLLFGSCFGREDIIPALWFHPMEMILFYLAASIGIGVLTISLGLALSLVNRIRMRSGEPWFWDKFGLLGLLFYSGSIVLALAALREHGGLATTGGLVCGLALVALMVHSYGENRSESWPMRIFLGLLEGYDMIMKFLVQTLSFARIAAFTLAHVGLSNAVVLMADAASGSPVASLAIMVIGNLFIIVLEGLLVSIQVVRLHFFEFFTKFVVGGGRPFTPLTMEEALKC